MKFRLSALFSSLLMSNVVFSATAIDLHHQPASFLAKSFTAGSLKTVSTATDKMNNKHKRLQQMYQGYPVWHATAVVHNDKTMNGKMYAGLERDLLVSPKMIFTEAGQSKAIAAAKSAYTKQHQTKFDHVKKESIKPIVYVDDKQQAHFAYLATYLIDDGINGAQKPMMIVDASNQQVYRSWDNIMTNKFTNPKNKDSKVPSMTMLVNGVGGNEKTGPMTYGVDTPSLVMQVFTQDIEIIPGSTTSFTVCALVTEDEMVFVEDVPWSNLRYGMCAPKPGEDEFTRWLSMDKGYTRWLDDEINGGFSPSLDAYYAANLVRSMYKDWYGVPALIVEDDDGQNQEDAMWLRVHYGRKFDNAFWDGYSMTFGDGGYMFHPLTSVDVTAHEISHGFTDRRSHIDYSVPAMGALHEAFSDMAAITTKFYATGNANDWLIGNTITKHGDALRFVNDPTKDGRSIDHYKDFDPMTTESHLAGGIYNKAFYHLATTKGWDIKKAFEVMANANMYYWTSSMETFSDAACGAVSAANGLKYNTADVRIAFAKVGVDTDAC